MSRELELLSKHPLIANGFLYIQLCPAHTHAWLTLYLHLWILSCYYTTHLFVTMALMGYLLGSMLTSRTLLFLFLFIVCGLYLTAQVKHLLALIMFFSWGLPRLRNLALTWVKEFVHTGLVILDHCHPLSTCGCFKPNPHRLRHICDAQRGFLKDRYVLQNSVELDHCALRSFPLSGLFIGRALSLGVGSLKKFFMQPDVFIKTIGWNHMGSLSLLFAYEVVFVKVVRSAHCFLPLLPTPCCVSCRVLCPVNLALKEHLLMILPQLFWLVQSIPFLSVCWVWRNIRVEPKHREDSIIYMYLKVFTYTIIYMYLQNPSLGCKCAKRCPRTLSCLEAGL